MFDRKSDELAIERGLDIKNYPVRWKDAKDLALRADKHSYPEENAFELSCRFYVELGGGTNKGFYDLLEGQVLTDET